MEVEVVEGKHKVKVVAASVHQGVALWTYEVEYWRAIHCEIMTHKMLNKNSASSRAIPVARILERVINDPAGPTHWGKNQRGMQAEVEQDEPVEIARPLWPALEHWAHQVAGWTEEDRAAIYEEGGNRLDKQEAWKFSAWLAATMSAAFAQAGYHKQIANRLTETFQYMKVCITATEWDNFFWLRTHKDAMPEFRLLASDMQRAQRLFEPEHLRLGDWHQPYIQRDERLLPVEVRLKLSTSRCASTSYNTVEGTQMTLDKAEDVFSKMFKGEIPHMSPAEHQACAGNGYLYTEKFRSPLRSPWLQYRKFIEQDVPPDIMAGYQHS